MLWSRRNELSGCTLRVAYVDQPPIISRAESGEELNNAEHILNAGNITMYGGKNSHLEILQRLSDDLNFTITWVQAMDNSYGVFNKEKGVWDGLIKLIMDGEADLSNAYLTITPSRSEVVSFSIGFDHTRYGLFMKKPSRHSTSWGTFIILLHPQYWAALISISILFIVTSLILLYHIDSEYSSSPGRHSKTGKLMHYLGSSTSLILLALSTLEVFNDKIKRFSNRRSFKYFVFVLCLFGLLNKETYTGGLISSFINQKEGTDIKDIDDLAQKDGHQLLVLNGTASIQYFSEASESSNKKIWEKHLKNNPTAYFSTIKPIEKKLLENGKYIYFERTTIAQNFIDSYPCEIIQSGKTYFHRSVGLGMKKDSQYLELFNMKLLRYIETGITANMDTLKKPTKTKSSCKSENYESVGHEALASIFVLVGAASVTATIICGFEILLDHYRDKKERNIELYIVKDT